MKALHLAVQLAVTFAGMSIGIALTASCSGTCECPAPLPVVEGEFQATSFEVRGTAPPRLQAIDPRRVFINADTIVVEYEFDGQPGTAIFPVARKY